MDSALKNKDSFIKVKNGISFLLIILALLANPWLLGQLLSPDGKIESWLLIIAIIGFEIFCILSALILFKLRHYETINNFIRISVPTFILIGVLIIGLDRLIGLIGLLFNVDVSNRFGLDFKANSSVQYKTPEFNATAHINSLGFRGRETNLKKTNKYRILMIGDSFTFGWGVDDDSTASYLTEQTLLKRGFDVEILNLGQPGRSPIQYAAVISKSVPVLKPNLVIINFLSFDDLLQLVTLTSPVVKSNRRYELKIIANRTLNAFIKLIPNISYILNRRINTKVKETEITKKWSKQVNYILSRLDRKSLERFYQLDPIIQNMYMSGNLDPGLLNYFIWEIHPFYHFVEKTDINTKALENLKNILTEIKSICAKQNTEVLLTIIPIKAAIDSLGIFQAKRLVGGFEYDFLNKSLNHFQDIEKLCTKLGIECHSALEYFRNINQPERCYFEYDSHFNGRGQWYYSNYLVQIIEPKLIKSGDIP